MNNQDIFKNLGFIPDEQENNVDVFNSLGFVPEKQTDITQQPQLTPEQKQAQYQSDLQDIYGGEDIEREVDRGQAQITSRALEGVLGLPGNVESLINIPFGRKKTILPTSQDIQKFSEKTTLGFTEPKSKFEKEVGEFTQDVVGAAIPLGGAPSLFRIIGVPLAGAGVKASLEGVGVDEKNATYGKIGAMVVLDLISRRVSNGGVRKLENELWSQAEKAIPENATAGATKLSKNIQNLENSFNAGGSRPSTVEALKKTNEIQAMISDGKLPVKSAMEFRKSINEIEKQVGAFSLDTPPAIKKKIIANLDKVKAELVVTLKDYGKKENKAFLQLYLDANEVSAALGKSGTIASMAKKVIPGLKSQSAKYLFGGAAAGLGFSGGIGKAVGAVLTPKAAAVAVPGVVALKGMQILNQVHRSPVLRRFYVNALKDASLGNTEKFTRNINKLDSALEKQEGEWDFLSES